MGTLTSLFSRWAIYSIRIHLLTHELNWRINDFGKLILKVLCSSIVKSWDITGPLWEFTLIKPITKIIQFKINFNPHLGFECNTLLWCISPKEIFLIHAFLFSIPSPSLHFSLCVLNAFGSILSLRKSFYMSGHRPKVNAK